MTVDLLTKALQQKHGVDKIHHDLVKKITGSVDRPRELIKRYKNESLPKIGVTVELLTTGIDVPELIRWSFCGALAAEFCTNR